MRLLPGRAPHDQAERRLQSELLAGPLPFWTLVERIADRLTRDESPLGWSADVGLWGPALFSREVAALVEALDGDLLRIDRPAAASWCERRPLPNGCVA